MPDPVYVCGVEFASGSFTDITADVLGATVHRALGTFVNPLSPGDATIKLDNDNGRYSPANSGSIYAGLMRPNLQLRLQATHSGSTYNLFRGYIDEWQVEPDLTASPRYTTIAARDTLKRVQKSVITTSLFVNAPVTSFATAVLSEMSVSSFYVASMADVHAFQWLQAEPALPAIGTILESGAFFGLVNGGGRLDILPRDYNVSATVIHSLSQFFSFGYAIADDALINQARIELSSRQLPGDPRTLTYLSNILEVGSAVTGNFAIPYRDEFGSPTLGYGVMPPHYGVEVRSKGIYVCSAAHAGMSNTKTGTFFGSGAFGYSGINSIAIMKCQSDSYFIGLSSGGNVRVALSAVAGSSRIFEFVTKNGSLASGSIHNLGISWNTGTGSAEVMVNSVVKSLTVLTTAVNTAILYANSNNTLLNRDTSGLGTLPVTFLFFDVSTEAAVSATAWDRFFAPDEQMRFHGEAGEVPLGAAPNVYLYNDRDRFGTNRGTGSPYALTSGTAFNNTLRTNLYQVTAYANSQTGTFVTDIVSFASVISLTTITCSLFNVASNFKANLTTFVVRGYPAQLQAISEVRANAGSSQSLYGIFDRLIQNPFIGTQSYAATLAQFITSKYAYPIARIEAGVQNQFPDILGYELARRIHIVNSFTGIYGTDMAIQSVTHDIQLEKGLQHTATVMLERVRGQMYLDLPGASGDYASTPDSAALDITGDIQIDAWIQADDYTPASEMSCIAKWTATGNQRSYALEVLATGIIRLLWSTNGSAQSFADSTSSITTVVVDGADIWIRATLDVNDGSGNRINKFYYSNDGETWTQLGNTVTTAGTTSIFSGSAIGTVGGLNTGTLNLFAGRIHRARIYSGIGGTLAADFNAADGVAGASSLVSSATGETWTVNGAATLAEAG